MSSRDARSFSCKENRNRAKQSLLRFKKTSKIERIEKCQNVQSSQIAQHAKIISTKLDDQSSIPRANMVEEKNRLSQLFL